MIIMSLRDGDRPSKQSPVSRGDCFATCARNDMVAKVNALRELQSVGVTLTREELLSLRDLLNSLDL